MLELTPRIYNKDFRWSLQPSNKIDTVEATPLVNAIPNEDQEFHTEDFTDCIVNGSTEVLPISNDDSPTHWRYMNNTYWAGFVTLNYAKARMECVWASGKRTITVDKAVTGTPVVEIQLVGTSSVINRGGSTFDNYPTIDSLSKPKSFSLATWIENNKTETYNYLSGIYENNVVSMNPWIRKVVPANLIIEGTSIKNPTTANDILTTWYDTNASRNSAIADKWTENASFGGDVATFDMFPVGISLGEYGEHLAACIRMRDLKLSMKCDVKKLSDYTFEVSWEAPVRLAYAAAARSKGPLGGKYDIDNYAFVDNITNVIISVKGRPYDTSTRDVSYGLDASGNLTTDTSDLHPIKIDESEALTLGSFTKDSYGKNILKNSDDDRLPGKFWLPNGTLVSTESTQRYTAKATLVDVESNSYYKLSKFAGTLLFYDAEGKNGVQQDYQSNKGALTFRVPPGKTRMGINFLNAYINDVYAVYEVVPWIQTLSQLLLEKYMQGKYVVECNVAASWALKNGVASKIETKIILPNGQYISRNGNPCIFEIKNIKKVFKDASFVYNLKLMEV